MHKIDHPTATGDNQFTEGNPASGIPATVLTAEFMNMIQAELVALAEGLGMTLDSEDNAQIITGLFGLPHTYTAPQRYAQTALAIEAGAVVWDCAAAPSAVLVLTGDVTSMTITGYEPGGAYDLTVIQDATGGWSCAMPAALLWPDGAGYEPSTDPDAVDRIYLAPAVNPADDTVLPLASVEHAYAVVS